MTVLGVVFRPQLPPERLRDMARAADDAGLEELWLWEDCFWESGIATAAAALAWTQRVRVGVGLLPVPLRNVALAAMEAATLQRLFGARIMLGYGHGIQSWMGQAGARVDSPITLLREHLGATRALLAGERVTTQGRYVNLDDVALVWPPEAVPPLLVGARGPRSLRLSGEAADGTILDGSFSADAVRQARALIDEGRTAGGRTDHHQVIVYAKAATGPDGAARIQVEEQAWNDPPGFGIVGDAGAFAAGIAELVEAGADTVVLQPTADDPDPEGFIRFVANEVRPLVG
jgi:alkanesulfonate monooxygenase SsuD/methylene tetrahydromethanopterin reductase-like flavin-dependent oxidoreductase (luciferase family)